MTNDNIPTLWLQLNSSTVTDKKDPGVNFNKLYSLQVKLCSIKYSVEQQSLHLFSRKSCQVYSFTLPIVFAEVYLTNSETLNAYNTWRHNW